MEWQKLQDHKTENNNNSLIKREKNNRNSKTNRSTCEFDRNGNNLLMIAPIDKRSSRKIKIEAVEDMCIPEHLIDSTARKNGIMYQNIYGHFNEKINICEQIPCNGIVLKNNELNNSYSSQNSGRDERVGNGRNGKNKRKMASNNKVDGENCDDKKKKGN